MPPFRLILSFLLCLASAWGNQLLIGATTVSIGGSSGTSVIFVPSPEPISALQFDLEFDGGVLNLLPSTGLAVRQSGKSAYVQVVSPNRTRFLITGLGQGPIQAGPLVDLVIGANPNASARPFELQVSNIAAVYANGAPAPVNGSGTVISVTLPTGDPHLLTQAGVWNAASLRASPIAPGAILALRAPRLGPDQGWVADGADGSFSLGGTRVTFNRIPAPLLYAGPDQINVIAPWGLEAGAEAHIEVTRESAAVTDVSVPIVETTPAVFTLSATGTGQGAILNQDNTVNSSLSPAREGEVISLYGTGLGRTNPGGIDGAAMGYAEASSAVSVTIGGVPAQVEYAGAAPSLVSGVFQINCRVPAGVAGIAVEVVVSAGTALSSPGVTVAIAQQP